MSARFIIRPVEKGERVNWEPLWKGYQNFYRVEIPEEATDRAWERLHDAAEPMFILGAYIDGKLTGIVHYIFHRSMWTVGNYCYLQDLFVTEEARGFGLGRALIEAVYEAARNLGASRVYWLTQESNIQARVLYDKLAERSGFIQYRKIF